MTQPRKNIVSISDTPYYHCIGRCVRSIRLGCPVLTSKLAVEVKKEPEKATSQNVPAGTFSASKRNSKCRRTYS